MTQESKRVSVVLSYGVPCFDCRGTDSNLNTIERLANLIRFELVFNYEVGTVFSCRARYDLSVLLFERFLSSLTLNKRH